MIKRLLIPILLFAAQCAFAETEGWITPRGKSVPNTDFMKVTAGFGAWLVVTSDMNWRETWNTPPETIPYFPAVSSVNYGESLAMLIFFVNPRTNAEGHIHISCDIKVIRPDGTNSVDLKDVDCANGPLEGNPRNVRLANASLMFVGEEKDPPGTWAVDVSLWEKNRDIRMPLHTTFDLVRKVNK